MTLLHPGNLRDTEDSRYGGREFGPPCIWFRCWFIYRTVHCFACFAFLAVELESAGGGALHSNILESGLIRETEKRSCVLGIYIFDGWPSS